MNIPVLTLRGEDGLMHEISAIRGQDGVSGATFTPSVDSDGNLSWTNDKNLSNPETINIKGPNGDAGIYIGSGEPPANTNIQIDPTGDEVFEVYTKDEVYTKEEVYTKDEVDAKKTSTTVTLLSSGWVENSQTVSVTGVTVDNDVVVTADPNSFTSYCESKIRCYVQASGALTFACDESPTDDVFVNVLIFN